MKGGGVVKSIKETHKTKQKIGELVKVFSINEREYSTLGFHFIAFSYYNHNPTSHISPSYFWVRLGSNESALTRWIL